MWPCVPEIYICEEICRSFIHVLARTSDMLLADGRVGRELMRHSKHGRVGARLVLAPKLRVAVQRRTGIQWLLTFERTANQPGVLAETRSVVQDKQR